MLKVKLLDTGEIKEVTRNVAFGLIDSGKAVLAKFKKTKVMTPRSPKKYKIK